MYNKVSAEKLPNNVRYLLDSTNPESAYIYGNRARMLLEGGPFSPTDQDPGPWTLGDLMHDVAEDRKHFTASPKLLQIRESDGFGNEEIHHCPDKNVSNIVYTGKIIKGMLLAGAIRDQILVALENPAHSGGSFWRWRKRKGEESLMRWFDEALTNTYAGTQDWVIIPQETPVTVKGDKNLGWIYPQLQCMNTVTGETLPLVELPYYSKLVRKYTKSAAQKASQRAEAEAHAPKQDNYVVHLRTAQQVRDMLTRNPRSTQTHINKRLAGYPIKALQFLVAHGVVTEEVGERKPGARGPIPKVYSAVEMTDLEWWTFTKEHWPLLAGDAPETKPAEVVHPANAISVVDLMNGTASPLQPVTPEPQPEPQVKPLPEPQPEGDPLSWAEVLEAFGMVEAEMKPRVPSRPFPTRRRRRRLSTIRTVKSCSPRRLVSA